MKQITFWYVRHGQTLFNVLGRMQGWCDSPLTELGKQQAHSAAEYLRDVKLNAAFCSTSERCMDTARIVLAGRDDVPLHFDKGLKEMNFGTFEGTLISTQQEEIDRRRFGTRDWTDAGGEDLPLLHERIRNTYLRICDSCNDGDNILIVSHGAIFLHSMPVLFGVPVEAYEQAVGKENLPAPNGFVGSFIYNGKEFELQSLQNVSPETLAELRLRR